MVFKIAVSGEYFMRKYFFVLFVVILTIQSLTFAHSQRSKKWKIFYSVQKRFSVELPRPPVIMADSTEIDFLKEAFPGTKHINAYIFSGKGGKDTETKYDILEFILATENLSVDEFY